jgi:plasmid stabilization system protein ParE
MGRLLVSDLARADIHEVLNNLEKRAGQVTALRYALEFQAVFDRLTEFPEMGVARPELGPAARFVVIDPYLLFYDVEQTLDVFVLRLLHGRRKITAELVRG